MHRPWVLPMTTMLVALSMAAPATGAQRKQHGCTAGQIQSPQGAKCVDKNKNLPSNATYSYVLYCSSTGKLMCCQYDNGSIKDHSCSIAEPLRRPKSVSAPPGGSLAPESGGPRRPSVAPTGGLLDPAPGLNPITPAATGSPLGGAAPPRALGGGRVN
jgi:hypothetical protein